MDYTVNTQSELLEYKVMRQYKYSQSRNWYDCTVEDMYSRTDFKPKYMGDCLYETEEDIKFGN